MCIVGYKANYIFIILLTWYRRTDRRLLAKKKKKKLRFSRMSTLRSK